MRWPIQFQLLAPMLTVVVLAIALASLGSAYFGGRRARIAQEENLRRVVATLTEAWFPLSESVLRQMSGLSGAEFIMLDRNDRLQAGTLDLSAADLEPLRQIHDEELSSDWSDRPTLVLAERSYLSQRVPVWTRDRASRAGSLVVLYPEDRWSALMHQAAYPALITGAMATVAIVLVATVLAHRLVRPIRKLGDRAAAIARGDFSAASDVAWRHNDEIRDLALSIHRMAEQLGHYETQVRRHEQLRTLDRLGAGMAHQLRNAATGGRMAIELHQRECATGATSESLDVALRQLRLMESYLQRFMALGRNQPLAAEELCLSNVVEDALALVRPACVHAEIDLELVGPTQPIHVRGDREALSQLIVNLATNAVEAVERQKDAWPKITVTVDAAHNAHATINVCNTGPSPSPQVAEHLFEPFVSGKPEGTGLGLYVARQLAEAHHGTIRWEHRDGHTCFTVELPIIGQTLVES